ncbi:MAG: Rho termination factor N-terminal domain-containing protein, partial [Chloroflexota bacterium]
MGEIDGLQRHDVRSPDLAGSYAGGEVIDPYEQPSDRAARAALARGQGTVPEDRGGEPRPRAAFRQSPEGDRGAGKRPNLAELEAKTLTELRDLAREMEISGVAALKKNDLVFRLLQAQAEQQGNLYREGVLDIVEEGFGFLRQDRFLPGPEDVYVSLSQIRRFGLRTGDSVGGQVRQPKESEKYYGMLRVEAVNGVDPEIAKRRPHFDDLIPVYLHTMFILETEPKILATR